PRHAGGKRPEFRPGGDSLDDPDEQRVLPLGVGEAEGLAHRNSPSRSAAATAPARSLTPSLREMALAGLFTVSSPITRRLAIARWDRPATIRPSTSLSRWDSPIRAPGQNSPLSSRAADDATRAAMVASTTVSPACTCSRDLTSSSPVTRLSR